MNNAQKILAAEYVVALGFSSWAAIKDKQLPWPPTVVLTGVAFGTLGIAATFSPPLASALGAGFLLAQLIRVLSNKDPYTGGAPKIVDPAQAWAVPPGALTDASGQHGTIGILTF